MNPRPVCSPFGGSLPAFHRQQIFDATIINFDYHASGIVVEVDGGSHLDQEEYDRVRDTHLTEMGLKVLRFLNSDVERDLDRVLEVILHACQVENGEA